MSLNVNPPAPEMRIVRIAHSGRAVYAAHQGDELAILDDPYARQPKLTGERIKLADAQLQIGRAHV